MTATGSTAPGTNTEKAWNVFWNYIPEHITSWMPRKANGCVVWAGLTPGASINQWLDVLNHSCEVSLRWAHSTLP